MSSFGRKWVAGALLALAACDDPARPESYLAVRIDGPTVVSSSLAPEEGVQCGLRLTATAQGAGRASWLGARFTWRDVATGAVLGTGEWTEEGARSFWKAEGINAGEVLTSSAGAIGGPHAFALEVVFEFTLNGAPRVHTTSYTFTCGADGKKASLA